MDTLPSSVQIRILVFRRWNYPVTWGGQGIRSPFNRLYWLGSGRGLVAHERQRVELRPGRLYLFPANQTADYSCSTPINLAWIHFNAELFSGAMDITQIAQMPLALTPSNPGFIAGLWDRFMCAEAPDDFATGVERDGIIRQMLACFLRSAQKTETFLTQRIRHFGRFHSVLTYIDDHLCERLTLAELARVMHLQPNYFSNLFCRHFGVPPLRYLQRRRIERAQFRIHDTAAGVAEIAAELGFCDQFHFSRVFRAITGCSPLQYRKNRLPPDQG